MICIQCAMKAIVEGKKVPSFAGQTVEEHMKEYHPDPIATQKERLELERKYVEKLGLDMDK